MFSSFTKYISKLRHHGKMHENRDFWPFWHVWSKILPPAAQALTEKIFSQSNFHYI